MFQNPFSFEGRIRRLEYGLSHIIGGLLFYLIVLFAIGLSSPGGRSSGGEWIVLICYIPYLWFIWAQGAKRCHDVGNSGWWQLIPFYGLWLLFQDGQPGPNQYGNNPKGIQSIGGQVYQGVQSTASSGGYQGGYSGGHNNPSYGSSYNQDQSNSGEYQSGDLYR